MTSELSRTIERVVENASGQLEAAQRERYMRTRIGTAIAMLAVVPIIAMISQAARLLIGLPAGFAFSWPWIIGLTIAVPIVWLLARTILHRIEITRQRALGEMDAQLGASERLVTADQFLNEPSRDGFMQAAIEDANDWAQEARGTSLSPDWSARAIGRLSWLAIPIAAFALCCGAWLSGLSRSVVADVDSASAIAVAQNPVTTVEPEKRKSPETVVEEKKEAPQSQHPSDRRPERRANPKGTATDVTPDNAEESQGRLADGETSESQQSSNPSSARGEPSSSGQPSKSETQTPRKPKKEQKRPEDKERPKREKKEQDEPSGSTAGQGSSRGSNNNAAASDWTSKSQTATPDDEDIEDEDDVDDEDEEQKSRGGVQPNMRDRRTPVNRDLQIGFGSNRPNPDANGRGGPGGQKKSRGVASLVLGVPIPDRITGQPNKGRIRITQQRITPEAEQSDPVAAEDRGTRSDSVGPIHHPDFSPWLQDFVRQYFLDRRNASPLQPNIQDQTTTTSSAESDDDQS